MKKLGLGIGVVGLMVAVMVATTGMDYGAITSITDILSRYSTATRFYGTLEGGITGNAGTVTTNANLTGPITSIGNETSMSTIYPPASTRLCIKATTDANFFYFADKDGNAIMTVDSTNNRVGIGTATPTTALDVTGTVKTTEVTAQGLTATKTSGNVEIDIISDSLANTQEALIYTKGKKSGGSNRYSAIRTYYNSSSTTNEATGTMYMTPSDGAVNHLWMDDSDILRFSLTEANIGTNTGTAIGDQTSDIRLKKDIKNMPYGLAEILRITPISFKFKDIGDQNSHIGFSAQEVQGIIPEAVYVSGMAVEDESGQPIYRKNIDSGELQTDGKKKKQDGLAMRYTDIVPVLVNAIKEQQMQIEDLKKRIEKLESR